MFLQIEKVRKKWHCGMPECVFSWISSKDPGKVQQIQRELIEVNENDFSKHNGKVNSGTYIETLLRNRRSYSLHYLQNSVYLR